MKNRDYAAICRECARLDSCVMEDMKTNKSLMYCSGFEKSEKLSEDHVCQIDVNKMIIATDLAKEQNNE